MLPQSAVREGVSEVNSRDSMPPLRAKNDQYISSLETFSQLAITDRVFHRWSLWKEPVFVNVLRSPGIDSLPGSPVRQPILSYRPARLHRLAESIPRYRFQGSISVYKYGLRLHGRTILVCRDSKPYTQKISSWKSLLLILWATYRGERLKTTFHIRPFLKASRKKK